ncbi:hypothetical protein RYH73_17165 [Olivibacter sp. CPCC 100613]|uniref:hypothetical protein n=1 Tax=Olivibacter sp. CPCC 100613 TaxID=3079931 RepID=UPI002FFB7A72
MKIFLQPHIQELKNKVLEIAKIDTIIAADCYKLALDISTKTHKTISQTTIKRVYGFAHARYAPSTFTLNALSQYCGYDSWADFIKQMETQKDDTNEHITWNEITQAAHNITRFTIQTNKHKCGISYLYTIERQSITDHIQRFLEADTTGCIISAPSGMGKTIGITHWVDRQLAVNHMENRNNIFLHVNSSSLFFAAGFGFHSNKWLAHLLNFPQQQHFEDFILQYEKRAPGNFYIIIDDFNNNLINNRLFDIVFKQLIDMTAYLSNYPWMKIIITLRPSTWQKYGHLIENHTEISKLWFTDFPCSKRANAVNLQPFTSQEIHELIDKISNVKSIDRDYTRKYFPVISLPLHFQYYYQLKGDSIGLDQLNPADEFAIASLYLHKNILKGALAAEKQVMLSQLIGLVNFFDEHAYVNKKEAYPIIKENNSIYSELLHAGILYEHQEEKGTRAAYQIRFKSLVIAAYFIAQDALEKQNGQVDKTLINWVQDQLYSDHIKLILLKWFIIFSLETGDLDIFNHLQDVEFIEPYQASLILFTCSNLDYVVKANPAIGSTLNRAFAKSAFIDIALDHLLLELEYELALKKLLRYHIPPRQKILLHTSLAFFELLYLRDEEALKHIEVLRAMPREHFADFSLNPLTIIENIHHYYRHNMLKEEAIEEIQLFCHYPERSTNLLHKQLIYVLGYLLLKIKASEQITLQYLQVVNQYGLDLNRKVTKDFKACIQLALAERYLALGQMDLAFQAKEEALQMHSSHTINRLQLGLLDLELLRAQQKDYLHLARQLILISKQFDLKFYEAKVRVYVLNSLQEDQKSLIAEYQAALQLLFEQSRYNPESFYNLRKASLINSSTVN